MFTIIFAQKNRYISWTGVTNPGVDVTPIINQAYEELDYGRFDPKDMQFTVQLNKHPNQYPNDINVRVRILGLELGADKGEIVYWYESLANQRGYSTKIKDLSIIAIRLTHRIHSEIAL
jgi:hypothetical protein